MSVQTLCHNVRQLCEWLSELQSAPRDLGSPLLYMPHCPASPFVQSCFLHSLISIIPESTPNNSLNANLHLRVNFPGNSLNTLYLLWLVCCHCSNLSCNERKKKLHSLKGSEIKVLVASVQQNSLSQAYSLVQSFSYLSTLS